MRLWAHLLIGQFKRKPLNYWLNYYNRWKALLLTNRLMSIVNIVCISSFWDIWGWNHMTEMTHDSRPPLISWAYICTCLVQWKERKAALFCVTVLFSYIYIYGIKHMEWIELNISAWIWPWCLNKVSHPFFIWFAEVSSAVPLKHKQRSKNINTKNKENK